MKVSKENLFNDPYHIFYIDWHHCRFYEYVISDSGIIYGQKGRVKHHNVTNKNYPMISLKVNNEYYNFYVHQLVAKLFIPNPNNLSQINHKDGNGFHNHKHNLEWISPKDNIAHARYVLKRQMGNIGIRCELDGKVYSSILGALRTLGYKSAQKVTINRLVKEKRLIILIRS